MFAVATDIEDEILKVLFFMIVFWRHETEKRKIIFDDSQTNAPNLQTLKKQTHTKYLNSHVNEYNGIPTF